MNRRKRIFSLVAAVLFGVSSVSAFAANIPVNTYAQLKATADGAVAAGEVVILAGDILDGADQLIIGHDLTINLDGHNLTIAVTGGDGIKIAAGVKLTIMDSSAGLNKLSVETTGGAGINTSEGELIINSGRVEAAGGSIGAGIGGAGNGGGGVITINGGKVTASSNGFAAGIGGARNGGGGVVRILGGEVNATGGILGGAGIGGGEDGDGVDISIVSGIVTANGGNGGAGIGGGVNGAGGGISITGGKVTATGGTGGAGIGGGFYGDAGSILITSETARVKAQNGGNGAKDIGPGYGGDAGMIFAALPFGQLEHNSDIIGNTVIFLANPISGGTVMVDLTGSFNSNIVLMSALTTPLPLTVISTVDAKFSLSGYGDISMTAAELTTYGARVTFDQLGAPITIMEINGVTPPVAGATPVSSIAETAQYTGTVRWTKINNTAFPGNFDYATEYMATIIIAPKAGFTLIGVAAGSFTVPGATLVSYAPHGAGEFAVVFPATAAAPVKTVSVGAQSGALTAGTAGSATFAVSTANIANGSYPVTIVGAPSGATVGTVGIVDGVGTLTVSTTTATPSGTYTLALTIDGAMSADFSLLIGSPAVGTESAATSTLYAAPSSDGLRLSGLVPGETIRIYSMLGQLVSSGKATAVEQFVSLREHGVYIVASGDRIVKAAY